jgi:hypothetical protein
MTFTTRTSLTALLLILISAHAHSQSTVSEASSTERISIPASEMAADETLRLAYLAAPIKSAEDLADHSSSIALACSPLRYLSESGRRSFLASLTFNEKGLSSFRYADLEAELSPTQIFDILALFGVQHTTPMLTKARQAAPLAAPVPGDCRS